MNNNDVEIKNDEIERRFNYHPPRNAETIRAHEDVCDMAKNYAYVIDLCCPDGREKSLALTHLEEVVMWTNAAIARG